jgi:hypothetical protein
VAEPFAPTPPGTAISDFARRNHSEIPSQTQSVSAFLPGKISMGAPFLRRFPLQAMPPRERGLNNTKRRGKAAYRPARLTLRLIQSPIALRRNATVMAIL